MFMIVPGDETSRIKKKDSRELQESGIPESDQRQKSLTCSRTQGREEKVLDTNLKYDEGKCTKHIFSDSFFSKGGNTHPISLIHLLESSGVSFDGNYHNLSYSFVPPAQVGPQLYNWIIQRRNVLSHKHTFDQELEGYIETPSEKVREVFWKSIIPTLKKKFPRIIGISRRIKIISGFFNLL